MRNGIKYFLVIAAVGVGTVLSGCQSFQQSYTDKLTSKMLEEATGAKMNVDSANGKMTIKTEDGEVQLNPEGSDGGIINVKTKDGESSFGGGKEKPKDFPADLPTVENAVEFGWGMTNDGGMLSYQVKEADYTGICQKQLELLGNAGWLPAMGLSIESEGAMIRTMENDKFKLMINCAANNEAKDVFVTMALSKSEVPKEPGKSS